jgi:hypothetical protein
VYVLIQHVFRETQQAYLDVHLLAGCTQSSTQAQCASPCRLRASDAYELPPTPERGSLISMTCPSSSLPSANSSSPYPATNILPLSPGSPNAREGRRDLQES